MFQKNENSCLEEKINCEGQVSFDKISVDMSPGSNQPSHQKPEPIFSG